VFSSGLAAPVQIIQNHVSKPFPITDLSLLSPAIRRREVERIASEESVRPFDLRRGPLLRGALLIINSYEHIILLTMHHIVSDGWSMGIFIREVGALYEAYREGEPSPLPELPIQYADYAVWQRQWLRGDRFNTQLDYWRNRLADAPPILDLPTDYPRPLVQTYRGDSLTITLSSELSWELRALSRKYGATLFMTMMAVFKVLLHRYSGQNEILVGTGTASRNRPELEFLIGYFVNMLVLRSDLSGNPRFLDLLHQVRDQTLEAYNHQDTPFDKVVEAVRPERNLSYSPIFQVVFIIQNAPSSSLNLTGLTAEPVAIQIGMTHFDMIMAVTDGGQQIMCNLEYNTNLFTATTIAGMLEHYERLLKAVVADAQVRLLELPMHDSEFEETAILSPDIQETLMQGQFTF
jgi:hypothetical protein